MDGNADRLDLAGNAEGSAFAVAGGVAGAEMLALINRHFDGAIRWPAARCFRRGGRRLCAATDA